MKEASILGETAGLTLVFDVLNQKRPDRSRHNERRFFGLPRRSRVATAGHVAQESLGLAPGLLGRPRGTVPADRHSLSGRAASPSPIFDNVDLCPSGGDLHPETLDLPIPDELVAVGRLGCVYDALSE